MKLEEAKRCCNLYINSFDNEADKCKLTKAIETVLQELDNSISKDKIKEKIEELKEYIISLEKQQNELISLGGDDLHIREQIAEIEEQIKILEELLEDK